MAEKGLGTPATRATVIEGLIYEKYMHRDGRELVPTAKAFQLMTLLRGLGVDDLTQPELTGNWEFQLAEMEHGRLQREAFMAEIAKMAERIVQQGQGVRPRHHPRRLRHAGHALPQVRRRGQGELPALRLRRRRHGAGRRLVRLQHHQDPGRAQLRAGRGRGLPARQEDRPAGRLPLQGRLALHRRAEAGLRRRDRQLEARVRLRRGRQARRRIGRAGGLLRAAKPGRLPQVPGPCLRARHQLRVRARGGRARHLRLQERQDHPAAAGGARADEQAAARAARPSCWRTSSPTRRGASSRPTWPTTRRKARSASSSSRGRRGRAPRRPARPQPRRRPRKRPRPARLREPHCAAASAVPSAECAA